MIVEYPGPAVTGQARRDPQYLPLFGLELKPGRNEVGLAVGRQLVDAGLVVAVADTQPDLSPPVPPAIEPEASAEPDSPKTARNRR